MYFLRDAAARRAVQQQAGAQAPASMDGAVEPVQRFTAQSLQFSADQHSPDPNQLYYQKRAHCVGYATFAAAAGNEMARQGVIPGAWRFRPVLGRLYFFGVDVHPWLGSAFWKDHDFCIAEHPDTGKQIAFDPVLYDYFRIATVALR